nr:hypothetical protein [uncultured bacterium]AOE09777.1 hypothetical protein [uncultured bacterium]
MLFNGCLFKKKTIQRNSAVDGGCDKTTDGHCLFLCRPCKNKFGLAFKSITP